MGCAIARCRRTNPSRFSSPSRTSRIPAVQDSLADHVVLLQLGGERRAVVHDCVARRCDRVADGARNAAGRVILFVRRVDHAALVLILPAVLAAVLVAKMMPRGGGTGSSAVAPLRCHVRQGKFKELALEKSRFLSTF